MSVDITHYLGIGVKLTDSPDFDKYDLLSDLHPQYSRYEFIRNSTKVKSNIRLIIDGMNGFYAYLMYIVKEVDMEDMWSSKSTSEFPFNSIESADIISELQEAYSIFNDGKELRTQDVKVISLFHAS